jgi:hypothetical protein
MPKIASSVYAPAWMVPTYGKRTSLALNQFKIFGEEREREKR